MRMRKMKNRDSRMERCGELRIPALNISQHQGLFQ